MNNFNVVNVALVTVGGILIYCGVKDISPKQALDLIIKGSKSNQLVSAQTGTGMGGSAHSAFKPGQGKAGNGGGGGGSGSW